MVYFNNFRKGEVSRKSAGRFDSESYTTGSFSFLNAQSLIEGGVTRRPPLKLMLDNVDCIRLIPYNVSEKLSLLIGIGADKVSLYQYTCDSITKLSESMYPWQGIEEVAITQVVADGIRFAQYYDRMYFASRQFKPFFMEIDMATLSFSLQYVNIIRNQDVRNRIMFTPNEVYSEPNKGGTRLVDMENRFVIKGNNEHYFLDLELKNPYQQEMNYPPINGSNKYVASYDEYPDDSLLETKNDYPAVVAIINDSLWFASTARNPEVLWKSRILGTSQWIKDYSSDSMHDFTRFQVVATQTQSIIDVEEFPMKEATDINGNVMCELDSRGNYIYYDYNTSTGEYGFRLYRNYSVSDDVDIAYYTDQTYTNRYYPQQGHERRQKPYMVYDLSNMDALIKTETKMDFVTTDSCGIKASFNTGRNDRIYSIVSALSKIYVLTSTGEKTLESEFSAVSNLSAKHLSQFGSQDVPGIVLNSALVFLQNDNVIREYYMDKTYELNREVAPESKGILDCNVVCLEKKNTPIPMCYFLMEDGSMRVLTYDADMGINSFSRWTFDGFKVTSIASVALYGKQRLATICDIGDKKCISIFDEDEETSFIDMETNEYTTEIETVYAEVIDQSVVFGRYKKAKVMWLRPYETGRLKLGNDRRMLTETRNALGNEDYRHTIVGTSSSKYSIVMQSVGSEPMTILAMAWELDTK